MYDKKLEYQIIRLLSENTHTSFKIKDIAREIRIKKHKHKDLIDTLFKLTKEKKIFLKNRKYSYHQIENNTKYITGKFDARPLAKNKSFAFVISDELDLFISEEDTLTAYHNDLVEAEVKFSRKNKKYGIITKIIKRNKNNFVGTVQEFQKRFFLIPDNSRIHTNFLINKLSGAEVGKKAILKVTNWGNREMMKLPVGDIIEVLGEAGEPEVEIISVIKHYELPLFFPEKVLFELQEIPDFITEIEKKKRKDFSDLLTFTIDPISAKDFDDAISLKKTEKGWKLYVHIADVAHYVQPQTELFKEAKNRGNSYYFPKKVIPMLPEKISNKICSLRPFEEKLTISVITEFDKNYEIIGQNVVESVIKSNARLSYEEVDALFENRENNIDPEVARILFEMKKLSSSLSAKRKKQGYLSFDLPETEFIFDDEGHIIDLKRSQETESHTLIENFMLIANEFVAKILSSKNTIYRVHEKPDEEDIEQIKEIAEKYDLCFERKKNLNKTLQILLDSMPDEIHHRVFDRIILRKMKKAKYDIKNIGHFGLALSNYTHFTSPIRRLSDLVIHHQIKGKLHSSAALFSKKELFDLAKTASEKEIIADEAEREVEFKNKKIFMKMRLGEVFKGIIVGIKSFSMLIELNEFPVIGVIELSSLTDDYYEFYERQNCLIGKKKGKMFKLMDKFEVQVIKVTDDIYFSLFEF
ncbi:MAG TPA: ribonuclease R [Candidatus Cloacimonetes bacterium]|nr:ribonuclease R [Candidatus Cloacimonadota bacterium]